MPHDRRPRQERQPHSTRRTVPSGRAAQARARAHNARLRQRPPTATMRASQPTPPPRRRRAPDTEVYERARRSRRDAAAQRHETRPRGDVLSLATRVVRTQITSPSCDAHSSLFSSTQRHANHAPLGYCANDRRMPTDALGAHQHARHASKTLVTVTRAR